MLPAFAAQLNELLPGERNTIEVFQKASPKVVYVHRMTTVLNYSNQPIHVSDGSGSGIIWDKFGHVVTNFHVVRGASELAVSIGDTTVPAKVIGTEPRKDIAVLEIKSPVVLKSLESFTPFQMASTRDLLVGQKAIAIGNPFGLDHTLTVGVISALGRQVPGVGGVTIHDMIQTDASINPGNSGGPLLDSLGRFIGMNTAIYSQSGSSAGIGFAVPSDEISRVVTQIIQHGRVKLAGIGVLRVDPSIARRLGVQKGVLVGEVLHDSPAYKAGILGTRWDHSGRVHVGDVIVSVNDHPVNNYDDLYNILTELNIGDKINVTVQRKGVFVHYQMKTIDIAGF